MGNQDNDVLKTSKLLQDLAVQICVFESPMSLRFYQDVNEDSDDKNCEENVKNSEEVEDDVFDDDDVYDPMTEGVGSSYNFPDVNKHYSLKTSVEGEVDEEPGGNVSARSRSSEFRQTQA